MKRRTRTERDGFSLVEVALALMVAGGGLAAAFSLFPYSLRQSEESRSDLIESTFASSVLETIAANVRQIDDVRIWNDPDKWWEAAISSGAGNKETVFGCPVHEATAAEFAEGFENGDEKTKGFSLEAVQVAEFFDGSTSPREVRYYGFENEKQPDKRPAGKLQEPAQWLLRLCVVRRSPTGRSGVLSGAVLPNRYVATVVSCRFPAPERYVWNAAFSQEYTFVQRP